MDSERSVSLLLFAVISLVKLTDYNRSNISMCTLNSKMNAGCMFGKKNLVILLGVIFRMVHMIPFSELNICFDMIKFWGPSS